MQIDNYVAAKALTEKMSANLPITVYLHQKVLKSLREQGDTVDTKTPYSVRKVSYSGDSGGIMCFLGKTTEDGESYVFSLTYLKVDPSHPLAPEIEAYQQHRRRKLAIDHSRGFAAMILNQRSTPPKSKKSPKGFG
jgi:hypothetical protein